METYKPGETVPRDGVVVCAQHPEVSDNVKRGTKFAPCDHWGQAGQKNCTWRYIT